MFRRIFQDYEGLVKEMEGQEVSSLKIIVDKGRVNDILLVWIGVNNNLVWYRIFIDGCYCGIDNYQNDLSSTDLDDGLICINDECINNEIIRNVKVESFKDYSIELIIELTSRRKFSLYYHYKNGECKMNIGT